MVSDSVRWRQELSQNDAPATPSQTAPLTRDVETAERRTLPAAAQTSVDERQANEFHENRFDVDAERHIAACSAVSAAVYRSNIVWCRFLLQKAAVGPF